MKLLVILFSLKLYARINIFLIIFLRYRLLFFQIREELINSHPKENLLNQGPCEVP